MNQRARTSAPIDAGQAERLVDFFHEVGMLRHTPRSGYAFLGTGAENVAEHSFRVAVMGHVLARLCGRDAGRTTLLCLLHDLHEARTGDFNYVNHRYNHCAARRALEDCVTGTGLEEEVLGLWDELEEAASPESRLAHDADQLDLICNLVQERGKGNAFAGEWLKSAVLRLKSPEARQLAGEILRAHPGRWWYGRMEQSWWVHRDKPD